MRKLFDFICGDCDNRSEYFVEDDDTPTCKECGSENQTKLLSFRTGIVPNDDSPKSQRDLANYLGNGQYVPGYKRG